MTMNYRVAKSYIFGNDGWQTFFKLKNDDRLSCVIESDQRWATEAEAQAVADRVNRGEDVGLTFASYADD